MILSFTRENHMDSGLGNENLMDLELERESRMGLVLGKEVQMLTLITSNESHTVLELEKDHERILEVLEGTGGKDSLTILELGNDED